VNDFSRGFATQSLRHLLGRYLDQKALAQISFVMSGGTEGALSPHWIVFEVEEQSERAPTASRALAMASHVTRDLLPEELGRRGQVEHVAEGVRAAMRLAGITRVEDVHFVQVKCPLLTVHRTAEAASRGQVCVTGDTLKSMGYSRGASALGVALALGEIEGDAIDDSVINTDLGLFSHRASASAGIELMGHEVVVLGMSASWTGDLRIDHAAMADGIDLEPIRSMLMRLGLGDRFPLDPVRREAIVTLLVKAEASRSGQVRGLRHTMLDDSDISQTRHARAFVAGALAGVIGHTALFVSGGAEHQGPDGGGPCAIIADAGRIPALANREMPA
jgi:cyanuric acid amidohydrolase